MLLGASCGVRASMFQQGSEPIRLRFFLPALTFRRIKGRDGRKAVNYVLFKVFHHLDVFVGGDLS